jgi:hypothetical protein
MLLTHFLSCPISANKQGLKDRLANMPIPADSSLKILLLKSIDDPKIAEQVYTGSTMNLGFLPSLRALSEANQSLKY